jgi:hypothetical protein
LIRAVYVLGKHNGLLYSREYAEPVSRDVHADSLLDFSKILSTKHLREQIEFMDFTTSRLYYSINEGYAFFVVCDKADDRQEITEKVQQLVTVFIEEFKPPIEEGRPIERLDNFIDSLVVSTAKVNILGFAGVGKATITHLLRGEILPLEFSRIGDIDNWKGENS